MKGGQATRALFLNKENLFGCARSSLQHVGS